MKSSNVNFPSEVVLDPAVVEKPWTEGDLARTSGKAPHTAHSVGGRSPGDDPEELGQVQGEDTELFSCGRPITCVRVCVRV